MTNSLVHAAEDAERLLDMDGPDFVRSAYLTLLRRKPDPSGRKNAIDFLNRGGCKIDLIWSLARSAEGRQTAVNLPGLRLLLRRRYLGRLPVFGWLLRPLLELEHSSVMHRRQRAIIFAVAELHDSLKIGLRRIENELDPPTIGFGILPANDRPDEGDTGVRFSEIMMSIQARLI